jgi:hypothetical protein
MLSWIVSTVPLSMKLCCDNSLRDSKVTWRGFVEVEARVIVFRDGVIRCACLLIRET